jgi:hypothetical protein
LVNDAAETAGADPPLLLAALDVDFELVEEEEPQPAITAAATNVGTKARFQTAIEVSPRFEGAPTAPSRSLFFLLVPVAGESFHTAARLSIPINGI